MSNRMSTNQLFTRGLNPMLDIQRAVSKTQQQISSNKRVLTPADDPIAATRILQLNQELAGLKQFNNSLSTLTNRLQREEVALDGVSGLIQRAQELITQSGNGALDPAQRGYIAEELQAVVDNMAQYMNARDASGEYLFSGYQGKTQPFVKDVDGRFQYQGDEGQRFVQIGPVTAVAANDSGYDVFLNIRVPANDAGSSEGAADTTGPRRVGLLSGLEDFIADLGRLGNSASERQQLAGSIETALGNLNAAQDQLLKTTSAVGARLNQVEAAKASNQDFELVVKTALSDLSDLDYAEAISQLTQETFVLEAAQASFMKISRLSLFNLL